MTLYNPEKNKLQIRIKQTLEIFGNVFLNKIFNFFLINFLQLQCNKICDLF